MNARALNGGVPNMTTPLSVHRSSFRHTELDQAMLKQRLEGSDRLSGQQQTPVAIVQHKNERAVFDEVLRDEAFHMSYTQTQLERVAPRKSRARLWQARIGRLWKAYLRVAAALASVLGTLFLRLQYFVVLPPFALLARRAARREPLGFIPARRSAAFSSQY